jgi:Chlamydia polymorphic membrane protein (Chlamydia_PMP) repeat
VIGNGRPASCTSAAVVRAVAAGGRITFNCGPAPVTIVMEQTASVIKTRHLVVLDGGGRVTLSGAGKRRILYSDTCAGTWSTSDCVNQPYPQIVVQNITFKDGYDGAHQATCTANIPRCWYGGVDGGGAIYVEGGQFKAVNSRFIDNRCYAFGPDLGGGAIRALAQYENRPIYITADTFRGGRCSNGGALSSISVQWEVLDSVFTDNKAIGWGANPASRGTPGGGSGGAIYLDGRNDNALIAGTVVSGNAAREGGGAVFDVVDSGWGALTFNQSVLHNNTSGRFQTFPGVYYDFDGHDRRPVMINSTVN